MRCLKGNLFGLGQLYDPKILLKAKRENGAIPMIVFLAFVIYSVCRISVRACLARN